MSNASSVPSPTQPLPASPAPTPIVTHQVKPEANSFFGRPDLWEVLAILIAVAAAFFSFRQADVAKESLDRSAGKTGVSLSFVELVPPQEMVHKSLKVKSMFDTEMVKLKNVNDLLMFNPCIIIRNDGQEPIDTIRIETQFTFGVVDMRNGNEAQAKATSPWVLRPVEREDIKLSQKLQPGKMARIPILKGLLLQMMQSQNPSVDSFDHYGKFLVRYYSKLVGVDAFDGPKDNITPGASIIWVPKGFDKAQCDKMLSEYVTHIEILP